MQTTLFYCDIIISTNTKFISKVTVLRSKNPSGKCAKLHNVAASNNRAHPTRSLNYCLFAPHIHGIFLRTHFVHGEPRISAQRQQIGYNNIPSFLQRTTPIASSFCEGFTRHDLYILVTVPFCCDRKARAASAQIFTLWQQATIEPTR